LFSASAMTADASKFAPPRALSAFPSLPLSAFLSLPLSAFTSLLLSAFPSLPFRLTLANPVQGLGFRPEDFGWVSPRFVCIPLERTRLSLPTTLILNPKLKP